MRNGLHYRMHPGFYPIDPLLEEFFRDLHRCFLWYFSRSSSGGFFRSSNDRFFKFFSLKFIQKFSRKFFWDSLRFFFLKFFENILQTLFKKIVLRLRPGISSGFFLGCLQEFRLGCFFWNSSTSSIGHFCRSFFFLKLINKFVLGVLQVLLLDSHHNL